jgi:hypothetical protein
MRLIGVLVACIVLSAAPSATILVPASLETLSRDARAIARGRVVGVDGQWTAGRRSIETIVTLEAETYLKGQLGSTIQFRVPGGSYGRYQNIVVGAPRFSVGQRVIVFLGARGPTVPFVLGLHQGVFHVERGADGRDVVTPPPAAQAVAGPLVRGQVSREPAALVVFERTIRALAEGAR